MAPVVTLRGVSVGGADGMRLEGIDLDVRAGEVLGLVGATGSGRSTLLRTCIGIVPQRDAAEVTGAIDVAGHDPRTTPIATMARDVGVVFGEPEAQLSRPTVEEEVAFGLENRAVAVPEMRARVAAALADVGLSDAATRSPLDLSGGEQQRVVLAGALAAQPSVLLLDEPLANLDPRSRSAVMSIVRRLADRNGTAVLVADHDVDAILDVVDRIAVLDAGRIVALGEPGAVLAARARDGRGPLPDVAAVAWALAGPGDAPARLPTRVDEASAWIRARW